MNIKEKQPVIVTAYWDVGRAKSDLLPRNNERYYLEFAEWARIRNELYVFTDSRSAEKIIDIRKNYGLEEHTHIILTGNCFEIEPELYHRMKKIEVERKKTDYYFYQNDMSLNADFDYAWMMKYWCIGEMKKYLQDDDLIAWMDVGFNHINRTYSNMKEFDFLWTCKIDMDKIHIFAIRPIEDITIVDSLQLQVDTIMGVMHLVPSLYAEDFWKLIKKSMESLTMIGCIDDDQQLLLMSYKYKPEIFHVHLSSWFMPLKENGANHLTVNISKRNYPKIFFSRILKPQPHLLGFGLRSYKRAKSFFGFSFFKAIRFLKKR